MLKNLAIYEKMWKKHGRAGQATDDNITRRMCIVCWITKSTGTHSEYGIAAYCYFTATAVTRTRINVIFIGTLPVLFLLYSTYVKG
jgi:hypothetical protein